MTQRLAFATAAGLVAFVVVLLGALGVYVGLAGLAGTTAAAASAPPGLPAPGTTNTAPAAPQQAAPQDQETGNNQPQTAYAVSADDAVNTALASAPGATLAQPPRLVNINGTVVYEVALDRGYVYVDAGSGQVLYNGANASSPRTRRRGHP